MGVPCPYMVLGQTCLPSPLYRHVYYHLCTDMFTITSVQTSLFENPLYVHLSKFLYKKTLLKILYSRNL